jgi:hypothetical protein
MIGVLLRGTAFLLAGTRRQNDVTSYPRVTSCRLTGNSRKLELLTNPRSHYQYELGLYVNIDGGNFTCTWYKDGEKLT